MLILRVDVLSQSAEQTTKQLSI